MPQLLETERRSDVQLVRLASASLLARVLTLPLTGGANLLSARIVVGDVGVKGYALFALVVTLPQLLPVGDMGLGAAVIDACSRRKTAGIDHVRRTVMTSARYLWFLGLGIAVLSVTFGLLEIWPELLATRDASGASVAASCAFAIFGLGLPFGLGNRILTALNLNHIALLLQAAASMTSLAVIALATQSQASLTVYCAAGFAGTALAGIVALVVAGRLLRLPVLRDVLLGVWTGHATTNVWQFAGPMTLVVLASSVTYGKDRLVLSHVAEPGDLAAYSAGAQIFGPLFGVVSVMGVTLWGEFARRRDSAAATTVRSLARITAFFAIAGLLMGVGLVTVGPPLATWLVHDQVVVGPGLMAAFSALLLAHACNYPTAMLLTDPHGLRAQAICCCSAAVVSVVLSFVISEHLGAAGPVIGSLVALVSCIYIPCLWIALHRQGDGRR
ncbi:oligosaccharide flippase family protein [Streptomyces sp. GC420]|uniref:lipopolysaccharide biosynthesis protein n=1 Tax=Streptomyces sp. GC420 TaxID=2697568 RepID=UPI001414D3EC|nr:oligosaccharide flippase family protein [Streptomyces sp. GC420]NBM16479.1 oligosaccharide flippase family protein [Streptomyces sp. GC420]